MFDACTLQKLLRYTACNESKVLRTEVLTET